MIVDEAANPQIEVGWRQNTAKDRFCGMWNPITCCWRNTPASRYYRGL